MGLPIKTTKKSKPKDLAIGIFGFSGLGKSTLSGTVPVKRDEDVLYIDIEKGLEVLRDRDFQSIEFDEVTSYEHDGKVIKLDKPSSRIKYILDMIIKENIKYEWIIMDSFTELAERIKEHMEQNPKTYDLLTSKGAFDGLKMYGEIRKVYRAIILKFLSMKGNKVAIFGAEEKNNSIEVMMDGSFKKRVMFQFDEFWGLKATPEGRQLVIDSDGTYVAKSRMNGGSGGKLSTYEKPDIKYILEKCYAET